MTSTATDSPGAIVAGQTPATVNAASEEATSETVRSPVPSLPIVIVADPWVPSSTSPNSTNRRRSDERFVAPATIPTPTRSATAR